MTQVYLQFVHPLSKMDAARVRAKFICVEVVKTSISSGRERILDRIFR